MRRVLVVDDDAAMRSFLIDALAALSLEGHGCTNATAALEHLRSQPVDAVLTDVRMPGMDGVELCEEIHQHHPDLPVIVLTGFGTMDLAVRAIRAGAYDFLAKPVELEHLEMSVRRAVEHHRLTREIRQLRRDARTNRYGLIGHSPAFEAVLHRIPKAARSDVGVLIEGETGTGKELLARALHQASPRCNEPFVAVNCSAIPENLVESELFGHVRGSFTDARSDRKGLFKEARNGTLFLDEVGELPLSVQPKLLRVLQERTIRSVGADREETIGCRVLAATHVDLKAASAEGRFRTDLYYRLAVIRLGMPPLRDRAADILLLAEHFATKAAERLGTEFAGLSTTCGRMLMAYGWPGNVRELQNAMERAVVMAETPTLMPADLPDEILAAEASPSTEAELVSLDTMERLHIKRVLEATGGNKKAAAEILGLDRTTLYRKLQR